MVSVDYSSFCICNCDLEVHYYGKGWQKISGRLKGSFGNLFAKNFGRNSFSFCRKKQYNFSISAERTVSAFGTKNLFFEATLYKGGGLEGGWDQRGLANKP